MSSAWYDASSASPRGSARKTVKGRLVSIGNKFIKNSFFNVGGWLWLTIISVATVPYIVNKLGYDAYGILSLVFMVLGYFAFMDLGLGEAVIKYVSHYYALKNFEKMNRILSSILFLFILTGAVGGLGILVFTEFFAIRLFKIPLHLVDDTRFCFLLSSLGFALIMILGVLSRIPEAVQRFDISNRNNVITGTLVSVGNVALLAIGLGLKEVVVLNLLSEILAIFLFYRSSKRLIPELRFSFRFYRAEFREVIGFGLSTIFIKFSSVITGTVNQLILGVVIGPAGVAIFNVPFKIISRFNSFIYRIAFVIFPVSSELHATEDTEKLHRSYFRLSKYVFLLSTILFLPLAAFSVEILRYWMGADFAAKGALVMLYCSVAFYFISFTMVPSLVALGMGKAGFNAVFASMTAGINLVLVYPFTKYWGVNGAAAALLVSSLPFPIYIYFVNRNIINVDTGQYFKMVFGRMVFVGLIFVAVVGFFVTKLATSVYWFLFLTLASYIVISLLAYFLGLDGEERHMIWARLADIKATVGGLEGEHPDREPEGPHMPLRAGIRGD